MSCASPRASRDARRARADSTRSGTRGRVASRPPGARTPARSCASCTRGSSRSGVLRGPGPLRRAKRPPPRRPFRAPTARSGPSRRTRRATRRTTDRRTCPPSRGTMGTTGSTTSSSGSLTRSSAAPPWTLAGTPCSRPRRPSSPPGRRARRRACPRASRRGTCDGAWPAPAPYGRTRALAALVGDTAGGPPTSKRGGALHAQGLLHLQDLWCTRGGCGACPLSVVDP